MSSFELTLSQKIDKMKSYVGKGVLGICAQAETPIDILMLGQKYAHEVMDFFNKEHPDMHDVFASVQSAEKSAFCALQLVLMTTLKNEDPFKVIDSVHELILGKVKDYADMKNACDKMILGQTPLSAIGYSLLLQIDVQHKLETFVK